MVLDGPVTAVAFDFDGTLFTLPVDWAGLRAELGLGAGDRIGEVLQRFLDEGDSRGLEVVTAYERAAVRAGGFLPGATECLAALRDRYELAVLTRNSRYAVLDAFGDLAAGLTVVGREDVRRLKPDPEGLRIVLARLRAEPAGAVLVGDTYHDVQAARAAGVRSVVVRNPALRYAPEGAGAYVERLTADLLRPAGRLPSKGPADTAD
ncbi:HAD family hydrolase [Amycolatopsis cihanbeyliensis]|uniref:Phosphoglycolate phosphatase n=1 Tax=Amycolatopsis cihanbeyliensis TaxID=1128664 RepID=A0A542DM39_AMYCI|nr:HAD-IA family hydrolase [Amycolatopsis cihanbeyliensis]TQJ04157.1 phosphoglycolate phosphatase [Amycolatopsis cihanbeyliensis]